WRGKSARDVSLSRLRPKRCLQTMDRRYTPRTERASAQVETVRRAAFCQLSEDRKSREPFAGWFGGFEGRFTPKATILRHLAKCTGTYKASSRCLKSGAKGQREKLLDGPLAASRLERTDTDNSGRGRRTADRPG